LPGLNGRELVEAARKIRPELKVLFTTGYARNAIVHQGRLDPGVELLTKPFTRSQLAARVREVLDMSPRRSDRCRSVLVAEDEELIRFALVDALKELGLEAVQASTATGALAAADETLVAAILDIGLPDRSGLDVGVELRNRFPTLPVIIASGYGPGGLGRLANDPLVQYLPKPFDDAAVVSALQLLKVVP
jgi:CheY-like chemotaxis protein